MSLNPLRPDAAIVDAQGRPTLRFLRLWNTLSALLQDVEGVEGEYGAEDKAVRLTINSRGQITAVEEVTIVP